MDGTEIRRVREALGLSRADVAKAGGNRFSANQVERAEGGAGGRVSAVALDDIIATLTRLSGEAEERAAVEEAAQLEEAHRREVEDLALQHSKAEPVEREVQHLCAATRGHDMLAVTIADGWVVVIGVSNTGERFVAESQGVGLGNERARAYVRAPGGEEAVANLKASDHFRRHRHLMPTYKIRSIERPSWRAVRTRGGALMLQRDEAVAEVA